MNQTSPRIRFGLIGCGRIGATADDTAGRWAIGHLWLPLSHASAIAAESEAELVAVSDVSEAAARQAMERYGARAFYTDYREMLRHEQLDAVAIATRTEGRKGMIEDCIAHGVRGLFCEKPACLTLEDCDALAALLQRHSTAFVYGTRRRFMPVYRRVKAEIERGRIGEVRAIVLRFGRSPLLWTHPHTVDLASFFAGDVAPEWIQADLELEPSAVGPGGVDADPVIRAATIRFVNGVTAHIVAADSFDVEISGSEGLVTIFSDGASVEWRKRREAGDGLIDPGHMLEREREENTDAISATTESVRSLIAALRGEAGRGYDFHLVTRNLEMLFGMVYSHLEEGRRIAWPMERRNWKISGRMGNYYP